MKHLKKFESVNPSREETYEYIKDILLELEDTGKVRIGFSDLYSKQPYLMIRTSDPDKFLFLDDLKDYILRIKDYLGDKYDVTKIRKHSQWENSRRFKDLDIYTKTQLPHDYNVMDIDEDTEIPYGLWSVVIKWQD